MIYVWVLGALVVHCLVALAIMHVASKRVKDDEDLEQIVSAASIWELSLLILMVLSPIIIPLVIHTRRNG